MAHCPTCNFGPLDGATGMSWGDEASVYSETGGKHQADAPPPPMRPKAGSITICCKCAELLVYYQADLMLGLRLPTPEEMAEFQAETQLWENLELIRKTYRERADAERQGG